MPSKAPAGAMVKLFYDGARLGPGEYLRTKTGRLYRVVSVRVQERGKHAGRQHLACLVSSVAEPGAPVRDLYWYARGRGKRFVHRRGRR